MPLIDEILRYFLKQVLKHLRYAMTDFSKCTFCNSIDSEGSIDSEIVGDAIKKTQGFVDLMTFDADGWR